MGVVPGAGGGAQLKMFPAARGGTSGESCDRRPGDHIEGCTLGHRPCRAFNTVEQMRAAGTGAVTLRSEHIAVNQDRREFAEQLGEPDLLGPEVGADALEDIILGHLAAGRKRAANLGHDLGLTRTSVVSGKSVTVRVDLEGRRIVKKKK